LQNATTIFWNILLSRPYCIAKKFTRQGNVMFLRKFDSRYVKRVAKSTLSTMNTILTILDFVKEMAVV